MEEESYDEEVKKASAFWAGFDLDGRRLELDARALEVADGKEAALEGKKQLSKLTSEFRERLMPASVRGDYSSDAPRAVLEAATSMDEGMAEQCRRAISEICERETRIWSGAVDLVRAYQAELDALSRRARSSDAAFLALYGSLYAAPDPANALRRASRDAQRSKSVEAENAKLAAELKAYDGEFAQLKNQELTIRKLEDALRDAERDAEARAEKLAEQRAAEAEREAEARVDAARERERALERRLQQTLGEKNELEKQERRRTGGGGIVSAAASPSSLEDVVVETAVADANERAAVAEREVAVLRSLVKQQKPGGEKHSVESARRLEEAESEIFEVRSALAEARREANLLRDRCGELNRQLVATEHSVEEERRRSAELEARRGLAAEERRELESLRRVVLTTDEEDENDPEHTVDSRLCANLRRAREDAASLRVQVAGLERELQQQKAALLEDARKEKKEETRKKDHTPLDSLLADEEASSTLLAQKDRFLQRRLKDLENDLSTTRDALRRERQAKEQLSIDLKASRAAAARKASSCGDQEDPASPSSDRQMIVEAPLVVEKVSKGGKHNTIADKIILPLARHANARQCAFFYLITLHFLVFAATFYVSHVEEQCATKKRKLLL